MPFALGNVPQSMACSVNGHNIIKDLSLTERFEVLVAIVLQAKLAAGANAGFDVCDSALYPDLTFQVKVAHTWHDETVRKFIKDDGKVFEAVKYPHWSWNGSRQHLADWYILFGIKDDVVHAFAFPTSVWFEKSYPYANDTRNMMIVCSREFSPCGSGTKRNKIWEYEIKDWPKGLLYAIEGERWRELPLFNI
jgi:hypothetical protein